MHDLNSFGSMRTFLCLIIDFKWVGNVQTHDTNGGEVAEWLAHWLLVLEVPGSIPASGEENLLVRTVRSPSAGPVQVRIEVLYLNRGL